MNVIVRPTSLFKTFFSVDATQHIADSADPSGYIETRRFPGTAPQLLILCISYQPPQGQIVKWFRLRRLRTVYREMVLSSLRCLEQKRKTLAADLNPLG